MTSAVTMSPTRAPASVERGGAVDLGALVLGPALDDAARPTDSTRTLTVSPMRSSARWALSSSTSAVTCSVRARTSSSSSLPSYDSASVPSSSE